MPYNAQMESLAWEDYYIPLWYGRKGKFTDIDESVLVDPIDGIMGKFLRNDPLFTGK